MHFRCVLLVVREINRGRHGSRFVDKESPLVRGHCRCDRARGAVYLFQSRKVLGLVPYLEGLVTVPAGRGVPHSDPPRSWHMAIGTRTDGTDESAVPRVPHAVTRFIWLRLPGVLRSMRAAQRAQVWTVC